MAFMTDMPVFPRKPRTHKDYNPKMRPIIQLEWNKLLAEATEKDTKLGKEFVDKESYYDDECYDEAFNELEKESETEDKNCAENDCDRPLNLCFKSKTMPILGNQLQNSKNDEGFSVIKKALETKPSWKPGEIIKPSPCTLPNFQYKQVSALSVLDSNKKIGKNDVSEKIIENKENYPGNNVKNIFSTPCNTKPVYEEKISQSEYIDKNKSNYRSECQLSSRQNIQSLGFLSERKPTSSMVTERCKLAIEESNKKKIDFPVSKGKPLDDEKKNNPVIAATSVQPKTQVSKIASTEKFAVPGVPAKPKESSKNIVINKKSYQILAPIGKGGSSKVYLVLSAENELLAVKAVKLSDVSESTKNDYLNEIQHLMKMQHSKHVIKLYDHQYISSQKLLFVVMEKGDTDLHRFLKDKVASDEGISPELIMYYWTEMLMAVKSIHDNNIIHRDLKPANFLLVSGRLKLIDFGIASSIQTEQTSVLMESQSGTFNYMSPEALQDLGFDNKVVLKIGKKTDVWSLGCILYYFLYKKTPYQDLVKPLHKMKAITDPNHIIPFPKISGVPDILIESCKRCLIHNTKQRASIEELLAYRNRPLYSLSQVLSKLKNSLSLDEYQKAAKSFEEDEMNA